MAVNRRMRHADSKNRLKLGKSSRRLKLASPGGRLKMDDVGHGRSAKVPQGAISDGLLGKKHGKGQRYSSNKNEINHVSPSSRSMESEREYSRRRVQQDFTQQRIRQQRKKRGILIAIGVFVALCISFVVAIFAFGEAVDKKLQTGIDADLKAALAAPASESEAYYTLYTGLDATGPEAVDGVGGVVLVYVDPENDHLTFLSLPADTRVPQASGGYKKLGAVRNEGGGVALVKTVSDYCDIDIAHYVEIDFSKMAAMIDDIGGATLTIDEAFYDTELGAGLNVGTQKLNGEACLLYCRSTKPFVDGQYACAAHQRSVLVAVLEAMSSKTERSLKLSLDGVADCVHTDMNTAEIFDLLSVVRTRDYDQSEYSSIIPGEQSVIGGVTYTVVKASELASCMERVSSGQPPDASVAAALSSGLGQTTNTTVDSALFSVEVRNGAGVEGCATEAADLLKKAGFNVTAIGNASAYVYDETLVVYSKPEYEAAAKSAVHALGCGRALASGGAYTFTTRLLVVVGNDWIPRH